MTHRLVMIKVYVKFHEYIPYGLGVMARAQFLSHTYARAHARTGVKSPDERNQISQSCLLCSRHIVLICHLWSFMKTPFHTYEYSIRFRSRTGMHGRTEVKLNALHHSSNGGGKVKCNHLVYHTYVPFSGLDTYCVLSWFNYTLQNIFCH